MVKQDLLASELTGDDAPTASEDLKIFLRVDAETDLEVLQASERQVCEVLLMSASSPLLRQNDGAF